MQQIDIIVRQIIILTLLGLTGFIAGKTKYLPENTGTLLSRVVVKLTMPMLIVTTMAGYSFTRQTLYNGLWIYLFGLLFLFIAFISSAFLARSIRIEGPTANIYKMCSVFGNVIFMAFPLISALYGDKGIVYAIFFNLANDTLLWTLGIYLVNRHNTVRWKDNLKHLVNGNTIAFALGILFTMLNLQNLVSEYHIVGVIYRIFDTAFGKTGLGGTTIYISMIFIGLILSEVKIDGIKGLLKRYPLFVMSFFKLVFIPALALVVISLFNGLFDPFVKSIVVLQLGMPCGTIIAALAAQYNSDYKFATENIFVSTILSVLTLPLLTYAVQNIRLI